MKKIYATALLASIVCITSPAVAHFINSQNHEGKNLTSTSKTNTPFTLNTQDIFKNNSIHKVFRASTGSYFIATNNGLYFANKLFQNLTKVNLDALDTKWDIRNIVQDTQQHIYVVATSPTSATNFFDDSNFANNVYQTHVFAIFENGNLMVSDITNGIMQLAANAEVAPDAREIIDLAVTDINDTKAWLSIIFRGSASSDKKQAALLQKQYVFTWNFQNPNNLESWSNIGSADDILLSQDIKITTRHWHIQNEAVVSSSDANLIYVFADNLAAPVDPTKNSFIIEKEKVESNSVAISTIGKGTIPAENYKGNAIFLKGEIASKNEQVKDGDGSSQLDKLIFATANSRTDTGQKTNNYHSFVIDFSKLDQEATGKEITDSITISASDNKLTPTNNHSTEVVQTIFYSDGIYEVSADKGMRQINSYVWNNTGTEIDTLKFVFNDAKLITSGKLLSPTAVNSTFYSDAGNEIFIAQFKDGTTKGLSTIPNAFGKFSESSLSPAGIAGIVIGVIAGLALIVIILYFVNKKRKFITF